jgi:hypothetical protein
MQTIPKRSWRHRLGEVASSAIFDSKISSTFPDEACEHCRAMAEIRNAHFFEYSILLVGRYFPSFAEVISYLKY